ncbi:DNA-processing protein DprA [soil metagenome]
MNADLAAWLQLCEAPGVTPSAARGLLAALGSPDAVLGAAHGRIAALTDAETADAVTASGAAALAGRLARVDHWLALGRRRVVTLADADYPQRWLDLPSPPVHFYLHGSAGAWPGPAVALVGSRNASIGGAAIARDLARSLGVRSIAIVSGLAHGIDAAAHLGALDAGARTVAILGTGCDVVYPSRHRALAQSIVEDGGAVLSEAPLGTGAQRFLFPRRNRLIAALSMGVVVVEAALRSGSLITARLAGDLGREVLAVPGSIHSPLSKGCHRLIKEGAQLVDGVDNVLAAIGLEPAADETAAPDGSAPAGPLPTYLARMGHEPFTLEALARCSGEAVKTLLGELAIAEIEGRIQRLDASRWQRLDRPAGRL